MLCIRNIILWKQDFILFIILVNIIFICAYNVGMSKVIVHIDLNAFFARCEEIKDPFLVIIITIRQWAKSFLTLWDNIPS